MMSEYDKHKGRIFLHRGDLGRARYWYEQALKGDRESGGSEALTESLGNLGNVCALMGDFGVLYSNLALQDAGMGRTEDAIANFKRALEFHRAAGDEDGLAVTYSQLGKTFLMAGKRRQAEKCLNNASEHFIKLGNEPGEAAALRLLADLYEQAEEHLSAIRCLERVVLIDTRYGLAQGQEDGERLARLRRVISDW